MKQASLIALCRVRHFIMVATTVKMRDLRDSRQTVHTTDIKSTINEKLIVHSLKLVLSI